MEQYINISGASSSSLVERASASTTLNSFVPIDKIAELKGLKNNRSLRIEINKENSKYKARKIKVQGGFSYEILFSTLEPEIQEKLIDEEVKTHSLIPINNKPEFKTEKLKIEALAKVDLIIALKDFRKNFKLQKDADRTFLELYNTGESLKDVYKIIGKVAARSTLLRWIKSYEDSGEKWESLISNYKCSKVLEYNTELTPEEIKQFEKFLFHPNKFKISKAIALSKFCLKRNGYTDLHSDMTYRRYAEHIKKTQYDKWVLFRYGEKAFNDKVEPYIERDISLIESGEILVADGHVLNFQVINPFTGQPVRATLVGFFDWKSGTLAGYEIMMSENTQCIASALRNSILNIGRIPKIVYQDNGKAFRAKYFQDSNFNEAGFNGVYANLGITSVFAKVRNAKAKVIERFFLEFQEEFEKMMPSYIGTSIENKPARLMRGENLHKAHYLKTTGGRIPTVQQVSECLNYWLKYHNSKPCPHMENMTIQECFDSADKQKIDINILNNLMMKSDIKTVQRNGVRFLGENYYNEALFGFKQNVYIRYSLFDLSKIHIYSLAGEFICVAKKVQKIHPMANHLGTVKDMEDFKQIIQKHKRLKNKAIKNFKRYFNIESTGILEIKQEKEPTAIIEEKTKKERKLTVREQQMNRPFFESDFEKYEWLMQNGCTNQDDRVFLTEFIRSEQYELIYGG